tara:strand:- start:105 stop:413 length:309 start_codon:yes stop_codon:yes gene_type:complete
MIYDIMTETDFRNSKFLREAFSYEAITALFEWYDELSESGDIEFDPVAITCDWSEYNKMDLLTDYAYLLDDDEAIELDSLLEILEDNTTVIRLETTYLIRAF